MLSKNAFLQFLCHQPHTSKPIQLSASCVSCCELPSATVSFHQPVRPSVLCQSWYHNPQASEGLMSLQLGLLPLSAEVFDLEEVPQFCGTPSTNGRLFHNPIASRWCQHLYHHKVKSHSCSIIILQVPSGTPRGISHLDQVWFQHNKFHHKLASIKDLDRRVQTQAAKHKQNECQLIHGLYRA